MIPGCNLNIISTFTVRCYRNTLVMTSEEQYQQYLALHRNFSESYSQVYKHVMDFYPQPQKFIKEAAPEIDSYVERFSAYRTRVAGEESFQQFFYFAKSFKEFATETNGVFEEYQGLHGESGNYIKTIFKLKEKGYGDTEDSTQYVELIPVLSKLIGGFEHVEKKTEEAAKRLQQLQSEWGNIKTKMSPTSWPGNPL